MSGSGSKYILAIDLGTSGPKVAVVTTGGDIVASKIEETSLILLPDGGVEQDPDVWWKAITKATHHLLKQGVVPAEEIVAVCCTGQWSGTVPVDRQGRPLKNAIIWMDARGAPHIRGITRGPITLAGYGVGRLWTWIRLTGGVPGHSGKDPIAHILFIKNQLPELYRKTHKFLEPKDYLNLRLTGRCAASYDSIALHWLTDNRDIHHVRYDKRLLRMASIEQEKLPVLTKAVDILGPIRPEVATELGLHENVQVVAGTPDLFSAAIGAGAVRDYDTHLYIGTSAWISCHVPFKKTNLLHNMASLPAAIPGRYFVVNEQETAGACLTFLRDNILYHEEALLAEAEAPDIYTVLDQIVARAPTGSGKVIFTPWLNGERTPVDDHLVRAGFHNLSLQTTRDQLVRAVYEGVAYNTRWLLGHVESFVKRRLDPIRIVGGGAKSAAWCQIFADVLQRTVLQVDDPIQANTRGAALLASVALGYLTFADVPDRVKVANVYEPDPAHSHIYDNLFREFLDIYKQNRSIYARLNRR